MNNPVNIQNKSSIPSLIPNLYKSKHFNLPNQPPLLLIPNPSPSKHSKLIPRDLDAIPQMQTLLSHSCIVHHKSKFVNCWGRNDYGQSQSPTDKQVPRIRHVAVGGLHTCVINRSVHDANKPNVLLCYGQNDSGQCDDPVILVQVEAEEGGKEVDWVEGQEGKQLDNVREENNLHQGVVDHDQKEISFNDDQQDNIDYDKFELKNDEYHHHQSNLDDDKDLINKTQNDKQYENNESKSTIAKNDSLSPKKSPSPSNPSELLVKPTYHSVIAGMQHTCGTLNQPELQPAVLFEMPKLLQFVCFGNNAYSQTEIPPALAGAQTPLLLASGLQHNCAVSPLNELVCWGLNREGQTNFQHVFNTFSSRANEVTLRQVQISLGNMHSCVLLMVSVAGRELGNSQVLCFGAQVDLISALARPKFHLRSLIQSVKCGIWHSCTIGVGGRLECSGREQNGNISGQPADFQAEVITVSVGYDQTCAMKYNFATSCWGKNKFNQLDVKEYT